LDATGVQYLRQPWHCNPDCTTALFSQNDVLTYGAAGIFRLNKQFSLPAKLMAAPTPDRAVARSGLSRKSEARLGMQFAPPDYVSISPVSRGSPLTHNSGFTVGVTTTRLPYSLRQNESNE